VKEGLVSQWNIAQVNRFWQVAWVRLQKVPKPNIRIRQCVITDGFTDQGVCLTGEACISVLLDCWTKQKQAERQGFVKEVQVADDSVVVIKLGPIKFW